MRRTVRFMILSLLVCSLVITVCFEGLTAAKGVYPTKPIKLVVPYNPGGGSDISARVFTKYAEEYFGQPIIVANISGAGGSVGGQEVLNSKPDGYTLFWHHGAMHVSYHTGIADFTWDNFTPVCQAAFSNGSIVVAKDAPWNTIEELMTYIKENPGKVHEAVTIGGTSHFGGVEVDLATGGGNLVFVSGGGDNEKITKLLGGFFEMTSLTTSAARDFLGAGKIKVLATAGSERDPYFPDIPTMQERGFDVTIVKDYGVFAPPGLPQDIANTISEIFKKMLEDERVIKDLDKVGVIPLYRNHDELIKRLLEEDVRYYKIGRVAGLIKKK